MLLLCDADSATGLSEYLRDGIRAAATRTAEVLNQVDLKRDEVPPCLGCLMCLTAHPGVCVHGEALSAIAALSSDCSVVVFLTPLTFGSFSSPVKNVIDRGGAIIKGHRTCTQVVIGYGADATPEERSTFLDLTNLHRGQADVVHPGVGERFEAFFAGSELEADTILRRLESLS